MGSVSNNKQICVKKHCLFKLNRIYYIKIYILIKIANGKVQLNKTIEIISFKTRFVIINNTLKFCPTKINCHIRSKQNLQLISDKNTAFN